MGGRGSSSASGKSSPIGSAKPIEVENHRSKSSFGKSKQTILSATANGSVLEVGYSKPTGYEHPNKNTTVEKHTLKAGFYNEMGSREIRAHNVDLSKATVVRGETFAIKGMLKDEGFRWDSGSKEWRR